MADETARSFATAYRILIEDLLTLCEYIDPQDVNKGCFSHRTFELLLRACTELENLWKTILIEKQHPGNPNDWTVFDYAKIESSHRIELSDVAVSFVHWKSSSAGYYFKPFEGWTDTNQNPRLSWYKAYNNVKHSRESNFCEASLLNVVCAIGALHINLHSRFGFDVFLPQPLPNPLRSCGLEQVFCHFHIKPKN